MLNLVANIRDNKENPVDLRKSGRIPAVYYGSGKEAVMISVPTNEFKKVWAEAGESTMITLSVGKEEMMALVYDVQIDALKSQPLHVDFRIVEVGKKLEVEVPIIFEGLSLAVKNNLGNLVKVLREVTIESLPKDLPQHLVADISALNNPDDIILVKDLVLPKGVVMITPGDEVVASIVAQKEENESVTEVDISSIEVEKKGKQESAQEAGDSSK